MACAATTRVPDTDLCGSVHVKSCYQNGYGSSSVINAVASDTDSFKDSIPVSSDRMIKVARSAVAAAPAPAGAGYEQSDENASPRSESSESAPLAEHSAEKSSKDLISSSFSELCNEGRTWSWSNAVVKIYRYTLLLIKQVYLLFMTLSMPTNHLMLNMRTLPRDFDEPNCNGDYLAAKFRNAVMPRRGRLHDEKSKLIQINRAFIETPFLGIPGIVRFIDVRTQWFDEGMQRAFDNGVKQVRIGVCTMCCIYSPLYTSCQWPGQQVATRRPLMALRTALCPLLVSKYSDCVAFSERGTWTGVMFLYQVWFQWLDAKHIEGFRPHGKAVGVLLRLCPASYCPIWLLSFVSVDVHCSLCFYHVVHGICMSWGVERQDTADGTFLCWFACCLLSMLISAIYHCRLPVCFTTSSRTPHG
eukprot:GHUV01005651.1.p1 GENE.GHUV01005651.1~~GHUV01005651.1.p1  ORF type:complete len:416 (+),score=35.67 GHUV01005651.1:422-1669(+)